MRRRHLAVATVAALVWALTGLVGGAAAGQDHDRGNVDEAALDSRWLPWLGCWQLWEEQFAQADELENDQSIVGRTSVCLTPAETGISLTAKEGERLLVERHLVADGAQHTVDEDGCLGWEQSAWSADGHRLFTTGELRCGDAPTRTVTGVSIMASTSSWVDIQYVQYGDREQLEVRRYSPMPVQEADAVLGANALPFEPAEIRRARRASTETLSLADVTEASEKTMPRVVEALLVETEPDLNLDSDALIALDDSGIDGQVIDLMVALSYPDYFVVEKRDRGGSWSSGLSSFGGIGGVYDPVWYGDLYPYYVTPLGARSYRGGYNPYLYGAAASPFVVLPGKLEKNAAGQAFAGRGYTRVSQKKLVSVPVQKGRRGSSGSSGSGGSVGGTGGGTATSGGYTSGGGGSSSGRQAVPRK